MENARKLNSFTVRLRASNAGGAQKYAPGHKPGPVVKAKREEPYAADSFTSEGRAVATIECAQPKTNGHVTEMVTVRIPISSIDQMWSGLTSADKVRVFEFLCKIAHERDAVRLSEGENGREIFNLR